MKRIALLEAGVCLNVAPGRTPARRRPLSLGPGAKLRSGTVLYAGTRIGRGLETGHHVIIREDNVIGDRVSIWNNSTVDYGCRVGDRVKIHCNVYVAQYSVLEDDVFLAPGVTLANDLYPGMASADRALQGPIIRKGAQIGVNATILPGVEIGPYAMIGAGSVVTKSVPARAVVWGNPARVYKSTDALVWPAHFPLQRPDAQRFYRRHLAGKPAKPKPRST